MASYVNNMIDWADEVEGKEQFELSQREVCEVHGLCSRLRSSWISQSLQVHKDKSIGLFCVLLEDEVWAFLGRGTQLSWCWWRKRKWLKKCSFCGEA